MTNPTPLYRTVTYEVTILTGIEATEDRKAFMAEPHRARVPALASLGQATQRRDTRERVEAAVRRRMKLAPDEDVVVIMPGDPPCDVELLGPTVVVEVLTDA